MHGPHGTAPALCAPHRHSSPRPECGPRRAEPRRPPSPRKAEDRRRTPVPLRPLSVHTDPSCLGSENSALGSGTLGVNSVPGQAAGRPRALTSALRRATSPRQRRDNAGGRCRVSQHWHRHAAESHVRDTCGLGDEHRRVTEDGVGREPGPLSCRPQRTPLRGGVLRGT